MLLLNIIFVVLLLGFIGNGYKDGFIQTLGRAVGAVLGFILAQAWSGALAGPLKIVVPDAWANVVAFLSVLLVVTWIVGFVVKLLDGAYKVLSFIPFLKSINSVLGAVIGLLLSFLILGGGIWLLQKYPLVPSLMPLLAGSAVAKFILGVFHKMLAFVL